MDSKMGYDSMELKVDSIELDVLDLDVLECTICFVNEKNTILPCAHKVCETCYQNIEVCPFCRNKINKPEQINTNTTITIVTNENDPNHNIKFYIFMTIICIAPIAWLSYGMSMFYRNK